MEKTKKASYWMTILKATGISIAAALFVDLLCYLLASNSMLFSEIFG